MVDLSYQAAFTKADRQFTAATEPASINTWHDDIAAAGDAINQWAAKNTLDTAERSKMPPSAAVGKAFAKADRDAENVAKGK
ncbi:hypothetical protein OIU81_02895 [Streptomyces sp. NBC_01454]|uniref:hypothetical protein n=1 Tax=Streptomyces sp. NBC_01454 TaxID=2975867 RepID=UPI002E36DA65|nr:hypothetical protein [Streptomyces sp. NBC_01454]